MPEEREADFRACCALFLFVFAVYLFSAYPALAPRDSADLALAAVRLGVAHPPGYPLYALLGRLWLRLLPLGNPAYRLNLLSAVAGAAACVVLYCAARRWASRGAALAAALALAWSAPLWKFSLLCEMYSLHALFIALLVLLSEGAADSLRRRTSLSAFLFGLGLVNHQSLILFLPAWLWLWSAELGRHAVDWRPAAKRAAWFFAGGLSLYAFVWLRLGDFRLALAVVTRREYGTFTLFGGFARPLGLGRSAALLWHACSGAVAACGALAAFLAACGAWDLSKRSKASAQGLGLGALVCGPIFLLATRFDLSEWVARSVLESAFSAPAVFLCLLAAAGLEFLGRFEGRVVVPLALLTGLAPLLLHAGAMDHREDFSAYDYLRDLRRELPPGGAVLVGGDTALFGLRYLEEVSPRSAPLTVLSARETPEPGWAALYRAKTRVFALGLPIDVLRLWGFAEGKRAPQPQGLVQEYLPESPGIGHERAAWKLSVLRWGPALASGESYAHDVRLSYAFAHYLSARLEELSGPGEPIEHDRWARLLDPEDYRLAPDR
ncbi:MAG: DUF2723 domain-containing protein [Elusimicrobia bacterium]|nr:DUF2723 domain-containing protein [Elusimicrobiota bacterium]